MKKEFVGRFRIVEMDMWGKDYLDMDVPAYMKILRDGSGEFQFGVVSGQMDCRPAERDGKPAIEFSWEGHDETDDAGQGHHAEVAHDREIVAHDKMSQDRADRTERNRHHDHERLEIRPLARINLQPDLSA